jgi:hypothetical protein
MKKPMIFGTPLYDAWHYSLFSENDIMRKAKEFA